VLLPQVLATLESRRYSLVFLHIAAPDRAGHASGFSSDPYLAAVAEADRAIATILEYVVQRPWLRRSLTLILTADHGGSGTGHSAAYLSDNYRIPFFVWGRGVGPGGDLYALNPDRGEPGVSRPTYDGRQPIRNRDAASLALSLLGLPLLAGSTSPLQLG
jgi:predicted AlkP superfamily pyrophosphatase or phosphodiesterase